MLVYDITNDKSFDNIKNWIRNIEEHASADVEKMILGNKCDMNDKRQASFGDDSITYSPSKPSLVSNPGFEGPWRATGHRVWD